MGHSFSICSSWSFYLCTYIYVLKDYLILTNERRQQQQQNYTNTIICLTFNTIRNCSVTMKRSETLPHIFEFLCARFSTIRRNKYTTANRSMVWLCVWMCVPWEKHRQIIHATNNKHSDGRSLSQVFSSLDFFLFRL